MCLPFVKFFSYTISYFIFICLLIASSTQYIKDENLIKLSINYNQYYFNYTNYYSNKKLTYRFQTSDMYLRSSKINIIDYIICTWLLGKYLINTYINNLVCIKSFFDR